MHAFRELIKGWLGKVLLGIVVLVFGAFGTQAMLSIVVKPKPALEVNGVEIVKEQVDQHVDTIVRREARMLEQRPGMPATDVSILQQRVLEQLTNRMLLQQYAEKHHFLITDAQGIMKIKVTPAFLENGEFSEANYERLVRVNGHTPKSYLAAFKSDLMLSQLDSALSGSGFVTEKTLDYLLDLQAQKRDVHYATIKSDKMLADQAPTDEELQKHFKQHAENHIIPEKIQIEYALIKQSDHAAEVDVTDEMLEAAYNDYAIAQNDPSLEQREASHILLSSEDRSAGDIEELVAELQEKLAAGESFADLAKAYSDDAGSAGQGGSLGLSSRGANLESFDEALFALKLKEVSEPVETEYGTHLILLNEIKKPEIESFESMSEALKKDMRLEQLNEAYLARLDAINEMAFEAADLKSLAEQTKLQVTQSDWLTRQSNQGIFNDQAFIDQLFSPQVLEDRHITQVVELDATQAVIARVIAHQTEKMKSFDSVKSELITQVAQVKAAKASKVLGQNIIAKLRGGASLDELVKAHDLNLDHHDALTRSSPSLNPRLIQAAFEMPKPEANKPQFEGLLIDGDFVIVALNQVIAGEQEEDAKVKQMRQHYLGMRSGEKDYMAWIKQLRAQADIAVNYP